MITQVLTRQNLLRAKRHVQQNRGSAGIDGMAVSELDTLLQYGNRDLIKKVEDGTYRVQPILGVELSEALS
ncbi:hypothetical protein [Cryomorpha ignava]|uniref:hypothetical protein n=1 Tax=Cryomorpha ignava TaxID=101383 RepID=UPI001EF9B1F2|nr:hypothetical protein [Cryomorpha ignava]